MNFAKVLNYGYSLLQVYLQDLPTSVIVAGDEWDGILSKMNLEVPILEYSFEQLKL